MLPSASNIEKTCHPAHCLINLELNKYAAFGFQNCYIIALIFLN